jgi:hypothetical protein
MESRKNIYLLMKVLIKMIGNVEVKSSAVEVDVNDTILSE